METIPHIQCQFIFDKSTKTIQWWKIIVFLKVMQVWLHIHIQKNEVANLPITHIKINWYGKSTSIVNS
jgi:hypothetical protein